MTNLALKCSSVDMFEARSWRRDATAQFDSLDREDCHPRLVPTGGHKPFESPSTAFANGA